MRKALVQNGLVVNVIEVDPNDMPAEYAAMPDAPAHVGVGHAWDGATFTAPAPPPVTDAEVDRARDQRLEAGTLITVTGYGDIPVQGRLRDIAIYGNLLTNAIYQVQQGATGPVMRFRDRDNGMHTLTPAQMVELISGAQTAASAIYAAAWSLKDNPPIPQDYSDDTHWP